MATTEETAKGVGFALNEAGWATVTVDESASEVVVGLDVLTLPAIGPMPLDRRRHLRLRGVSRVVASYRDGRWDDPEAKVLPLKVGELNQVLGEFGELPVYGWEFIDAGDDSFRSWQQRLSFDLRCGGPGSHTLDLFQENGRRILDFRVWFETLNVCDSGGQRIPGNGGEAREATTAVARVARRATGSDRATGAVTGRRQPASSRTSRSLRAKASGWPA